MMQELKDIKSQTIICAVQKWFAIFEPPKAILSDNGSQFLSYIYEHFMKSHNVKIKYTKLISSRM